MGFGKPKTPLTPEEQVERNRRRAIGLSVAAEAFKQGDPVGRAIGLQQQFEQQEAQAERERLQAERQKFLETFAQTNPELAKMYKLFGEKGLQQGYLRQQEIQESAASSQQQIQRYKDAGFSDQEISLILADVTPKDVIELRTEPLQTFETKTPQDLTAEVQEEKLKNPEQLQKLQNIDQAFSFADAVQQTINVGVGPILGTPFKETAEAVSEKNVLNERVREKFVNQYSGRPSVYINQRVDALLPLGQFIDETIAASKYEDVQKILKEGLTEMGSKLNSGAYKGTELLEVQNQYKSIQSLVSDLDVAITSLRKTKPKKETLEASEVFKPTGTYDAYFTGRVKKPQG